MGYQYDDWHWWRASEEGRLKGHEEFEKLPDDIQGEFLNIMLRWLKGEAQSHEVKPLERPIWELRTRQGNNHYRVLFCVDDRVGIVLTCFYKNSQQTPSTSLKLARKRAKTGSHAPFSP